MSGVLVLNASYEPHQRVNLAHAIRMLVRKVAVVEEAVDGKTLGPYPFPKVLRLVRYVYVNLRYTRPRWSKSRLLERDHHKCAFCGKHATTVDHVNPVSKGGESTWLNTVAACQKCNHKKANRTPEEAGMRLLIKPFEPSWREIGVRV